MRRLSGYGPSLLVLATAVLVLLAGPQAVRQLTFEQTNAKVIQASRRLAGNDILEQLNQASRDIATMVEPSVVHISAQQRIPNHPSRRELMSLSTGSGWVYDEDGHIVTNYHVVKGADRIEAQLHTGELRPAELVGSDQFTDIAVLKVSAGRLRPAFRASQDASAPPVQQGDMVFAFGSPFDFRFSMSAGIVSGKGRSVGVIRGSRGQWSGYENFIQVDAAINPGNSGGPLTNVRGELIGMNTAIATGRRQEGRNLEEGQFAGIGLAIPLDMIEPVVQQIIEDGVVRKGFLGVEAMSMEDLTDTLPRIAEELRRLGFVGHGVYVRVVVDDGPAAAAGIEPGDVIVHVNDQDIATFNQLRSVISSILPGDVAQVEVWRYEEESNRGHTRTFSVRLDRLDTIEQYGSIPPDQPRDELRQFGIARMATATPDLAADYEVAFHQGVLIEKVVAGSGLQERGVEAGSIIVSVRDYAVPDVDAFIKRLSELNLRRPILATIIAPDGSSKRILLRVER